MTANGITVTAYQDGVPINLSLEEYVKEVVQAYIPKPGRPAKIATIRPHLGSRAGGMGIPMPLADGETLWTISQ